MILAPLIIIVAAIISACLTLALCEGWQAVERRGK